MKHRIITTLAALICFAVGYAGNISVGNVSLKPGETKDLVISLGSGVSDMCGVQFDVTLSEGISLVQDDDEKEYKISSVQPNDLVCELSNLGNGTYRFILYSSSLKKLKTGELMSLHLKASSDKNLGNYALTFSVFAFSNENGAVTKESGINATVKVTDFFTLLYKVDGEDYKSYDVEYGATITPEPAPTKEGYTFSGWSEIPETMPANNVTITGTFTAIILPGSMTPPVAKSDLVYNGAAQDLISAGSSTTGTVQYSLDGTTYAETIPQGINAENYTIYYRLKGDAFHYDIAAQSFAVTIAAKTVENPTITLSQTSYTYDGSAKEPTVTVKDGNSTIPTSEYSVGYTNNTNVGTATVTITDVEGGNYNVSGSTTFAISSADGSLTPPTGKSDLVYNGSAQDLITAGSSTTGTVQYSLDGTTYATTIPQGINAGCYTVYYRVKGDANHSDVAAQNFSVTIAAKTVENLTITLSQTSYTFDGTAKEPTVTVKDGGTTIPSTEYSVSYTNNTNVGTATVTITDVEGGNYTVSGSTTFAISSADGSLTPPTGKSDLVYNGSAQDLITAGSSTTGTVQYSLDGTTYATTIPQGTNAGSYTVYYRVKGDANHSDVAAQNFSVTIAAKTVENPTITLSQTSYTFDGTAKEPTVTVKDGGTTIPSTEYSVSYTNNTNVGTATVNITDVEGGNYNVSGSTTFAISSADGSLTPPTGKSDLVYNGAAQDLITAGSSTTGTVQYSLDGTTYATTIPQGTNAGSYTVYYRVKGDANHSDVAAQNFQVTIASKTVESPTITLSETSYTYDGNAKEPTVTVKDGETTIPATEYSVGYTNNTNVGTATVTITDVEGGNYTVSGSTTFAISSADGSLTPPTGKSDLVYNGAAQDLITAGTSTTGTVQYSLDGTTYSTSIPQGTNAGNYTVYYRVKGDANHSDVAAQNFSVTIAAKTVDNPTITLSQTSYTFDGTAKEPTVTVKDGGTTIPSTEYSVSYTNNTNVGTATVTITDKDGGNYNVSGSITFAISSADGSLTPPSGISNLVYTGKAQNLITAGSTNTGTMQYSLDGTTYATSIPQGTDAGSYTVYYRVKGDANHNDIAAQHFDVKITKAPLKVSVGNYEIVEGEAIPAFDAKYEGFVNNETADVLTTKPSISCEATNSSPAGEYKVKASGAEAKNYEISYVDGKLTILAKKFEAGGDDNKDEDDTATYQITSQGSGSDTPPTVAITDDKDVADAFAIPEEVVHNGVTYKVTEIGEGTFENNTNLTEVTIPSSITSIGDKAFKGCSNLKSITLYITTPISLAVAGTRGAMTRADGNSVFDGVDKATCILYVPEGSVDLYKAAPVWKDFQNIFAIGTTGINGIIMNNEPQDIYDLQGRKVRAKSVSLEGLPRGIYIINGKKISIK